MRVISHDESRSTFQNHPHPRPSTSHEYVGTPEYRERG
jgi:hypothetical protein